MSTSITQVMSSLLVLRESDIADASSFEFAPCKYSLCHRRVGSSWRARRIGQRIPMHLTRVTVGNFATVLSACERDLSAPAGHGAARATVANIKAH
jgi:hypothetical protein